MIPLATTTITVRTVDDAGADPTDAPTVSTRASGAPAHIGSPNGNDQVLAGEQETVDAALQTDTQVGRLDLIDDETTGETWAVVWARFRTGLGLDHWRAGLRRVTP